MGSQPEHLQGTLELRIRVRPVPQSPLQHCEHSQTAGELQGRNKHLVRRPQTRPPHADGFHETCDSLSSGNHVEASHATSLDDNAQHTADDHIRDVDIAYKHVTLSDPHGGGEPSSFDLTPTCEPAYGCAAGTRRLFPCFLSDRRRSRRLVARRPQSRGVGRAAGEREVRQSAAGCADGRVSRTQILLCTGTVALILRPSESVLNSAGSPLLKARLCPAQSASKNASSLDSEREASVASHRSILY